MSINKVMDESQAKYMLNNKNICEFEAGVKQFSELQILTQHRCMMLALNKLFELVQRAIQLEVFNR